jgi:hypothetical protein
MFKALVIILSLQFHAKIFNFFIPGLLPPPSSSFARRVRSVSVFHSQRTRPSRLHMLLPLAGLDEDIGYVVDAQLFF